MTIQRQVLRRLAYTGLLLVLPLDAAFAQEATAIADRLKAVMEKQGVDLAWSNITGDASAMVIEGVTVKPAGEAEALTIGNITLNDVSEENGGFKIGSLTTEPFTKSQDGMTLSMSSLTLEGLNVPADDNTDPLASVMLYDAGELDSLSVTVGDKTAFSLDGLAFSLEPPVEAKPMEFTGAVEKFTADLTLVEEPEAKEVINALGYQNISGYMEMAGSWQPSDGLLSLSQYDITIDKGGTLGMTFEVGGYTLDVIKSLQELNKKLAETPEGADNSAAGLQMLGLLQQLTLNGASIRFDDDSITSRSLDLVAARSNMKRSDVTNQAKALVPFLVTSLGNPDLASQISAAVNTYLDDPKSIEVVAEPDSPVPFAQIAAAASANPLDLTKTLGVSVTANQD